MINWAVRFKNKQWVMSLISLIVVFIYNLLNLFGISPVVEQSTILKLAEIILLILGSIGVIQDPTTHGLGDSQRALGYTTPWVDEQ